MGYWESPRKLAHITLEKRTHFLVHSVDALNGSYYNNFLKDVPVSCSVFDVNNPWWYKYNDRRIAMPDIWDFDMTFQFRLWVDRRELLRQMYKHDPNDVGEVIVLGKPCAVIVRDTDRIPNWPDEELAFSRFFGTHIYISENKKLKFYGGQ